MKKEIHPELHPVVFLDTSTGAEFLTTSTLTSEEKKKIGGVDHYIIKIEISSKSHPFYTGKRKLVDTAGRVDKFLERAKKAQQMQEKKTEKVDDELDDILQEEEVETKEEVIEEKPKKVTKKKAATKKAPAKPKKATTKKTTAKKPAKKTIKAKK